MASQARFRIARKRLAPRWLTEGDGELVGYALDLMRDAFVERVRLGLMARLPQNDPTGLTTAPSDALVAMGRDRRVVRGVAESEIDYAKRMLSWLSDRRTAGNPFTLMRKLAEYLGPLPSYRTVDASGNWYSRAANGVQTALLNQGNWNWSGPEPARWSRFWVVIYPNGLWTTAPNNWGDVAGPDWTEGTGTIGTTATPDQSATVRFLVNDWKPGGTRCVNVIIALDPASFNPTTPEPNGLWERWSKNVAGTQVSSRLATARYWDGI